MSASEIKVDVNDERSTTAAPLTEVREEKRDAPAQERKPSTRVMRCDFSL